MSGSVLRSVHPVPPVSPCPPLPVSRWLLLEVTPCILVRFLFERTPLYPPPQTQPESLCLRSSQLLHVFCLVFQLHRPTYKRGGLLQLSCCFLTTARNRCVLPGGCVPLSSAHWLSCLPVTCAEKGVVSLQLCWSISPLNSVKFCFRSTRARADGESLLPSFRIRSVTVFKEHLLSM